MGSIPKKVIRESQEKKPVARPKNLTRNTRAKPKEDPIIAPAEGPSPFIRLKLKSRPKTGSSFIWEKNMPKKTKNARNAILFAFMASILQDHIY